MVDARMTCEECGETGHMGSNCPRTRDDVNFIGNNGYHPNQGFNSGWNKTNFPFDNRQQGGNGQNSNRNESSLRDIIQDQLRVNENIRKKFSANDKILENMGAKMDSFNTAMQNQLSFNKMLDTHIQQIASALQQSNNGDPSGEPIQESVKAITMFEDWEADMPDKNPKE